MILENWYRKYNSGGMFSNPDGRLSTDVFGGKVFGLNGIKDGEEITIPLDRYDYRERAFRDKEGRLFRLRNPHPGYVSIFPNIKKALDKAIENKVFSK